MTASPIAVPRATAVDSPDTHRPLRGRDEIVGRLLDICARASNPPIAAITGPAGVGRTSVLDRLRARLAELDVTTVDLRLTRRENDPARLVSRLAGQLGVRSSTGAAPLKRLLADVVRGRVVVLLDDAQWIAPDCLSELAGLAAVVRDRLTVVCAFRTPTACADVGALRRRGLIHLEHLRPLGESVVRRVLVDRFQVEPAPELVASARRASRGLPAFLHATVDGYLDADRLRLVDRHVRLTTEGAPHPSGGHPLVVGLRELGHPYWPVIKALAVLHPLRGPVPRLIAEATGIDENRVLDVLRALADAGIVLAPGGPGNWRFRMPVLPSLLSGCLGPYERRRLSALAVTALWNGDVSCADSKFLPERLVEAGRLVDPERAASELLARGESAPPGTGRLADRWGLAAIRIRGDRALRADALFRHAAVCALHQRFDSAANSAETALRSYQDQFARDTTQQLEVLHVVAVASSADPAALRDLVAAAPQDRFVTRAAGLCLLDRWAEAHAELTRNADDPEDVTASTAALGHALRDAVASVLGRSRGPEPAPELHGTAATVRTVLVRALTLFGDLDAASPTHEKSPAEHAIDAGRSGHWEDALDFARDSIATASTSGRSPGLTAMFRTMVDIFVARGQLHRARATIEEARSRHLLLPHLLAAAEADLERALGDHQRARAILGEGLRLAARDEVAAGTDELWRRLVELEWHDGNRCAAEECAAMLDRIAPRLGTIGARRNQLLARTLVHRDTKAANEAVTLTEEHGGPVDLAHTLATVGAGGLGGERTLRTAYALFGQLDALVPRARLRLVMRERRITIPGRDTTVSETERLLATLIAEGLTNAQLAVILGASAKSVEGRLTRLFQRTGYRSRAELATAVLNADFQDVLTSQPTRTCAPQRQRAA